MVTTKSQGAQPSQAEQVARAQDRSGGVASADVHTSEEKVGIVFVHGIGSQKQGETLLQWSAPIIEVITAWRRRARAANLLLDDSGPLDPVEIAELDYESPLPVVTVRIPKVRIGEVEHPETRWLMTEAWWASKVEPPALATLTSWLGPRGGTEQIVAGILGNPSGNPGWLGISKKMVLPFVTVFSALILTLFAFVRAVSRLIPIDAVRDSAALREFDGFLTGWFGDIRILIFDPVQSANIRTGLARAIEALRGIGCGPIVIVAHSGGAMVSVLALTDPRHREAHVDKLVTFGEGWNLAVRLTPQGPPGSPMAGMADRLRAGVGTFRPKLRWTDFWASNDPAPAGELLVGKEMTPKPAAGQVVSKRVWNRRSLLDDHGSYWDNDEEFIIPLLRELDDPTGDGSASRFYPVDAAPRAAPAAAASEAATSEEPPEEAGLRASRHRERVAALAVWRQACIVFPIATIAIAIVLAPSRLIAMGQTIADALIRIPGVKLLEGPFHWLRTLELGVIPVINVPTVPLLVEFGVWVLQAVVFIAILQLLFAPVRAFHAWKVGAPMRAAVFAAECILGGLLVIAALVVISADLLLGWLQPIFPARALDPPGHGLLLGSSGADWLGGLLVTAGLIGLSFVSSWLVSRWKTPIATMVVGSVGSALFIVALVAAVLAIFKRPGIELAELAYAAIWIAFVIAYRIGHAFWRLWDRRERQDAYDLEVAAKVNRWPAIVGAASLTMVAVSLSVWVLGLAVEIPILLTVASAVLAAFTLYLAGQASTGSADPVSAPGPVMSARSD
jgi:hypothetical protein